MPKVSVGIPVYNAEAYIGAAVQSVLNQTLKDFELIITDDQSTDRTPEIIQKFSDPRIRYYRNEKRLGPPGNFNRCIKLADSEYISIFHADDLMEPENLEKKKAFLDSNPEAGFVHSNIFRVDSAGKVLGEHWHCPAEKDTLFTGKKVFLELFDGINFICAPSVMMRRECFRRTGKFEETLLHACDWEMWMKTALFFKVGYLAEPLVRYRVHEQMHSGTYFGYLKGEEEYLQTKVLILKKYEKDIPESEKLKRKMLKTAALRGLDFSLARFSEKKYREGFKLLMFSIKKAMRFINS